METNRTARSRHMALISSAALWAAALLITGVIGGLWFLLAADSVRSAISLAAVLALPAAVGITWQHSRARARRRLQAALDAYAEREISHADQRRQKRRTAPDATETRAPIQDVLNWNPGRGRQTADR